MNLFKRPKMVKMSPMVKKAYTINEIAEALGMFPHEVEVIVKEFLEKGQVHVHWYKSQLYVSLNSNIDEFISKVKEEHPEMPYIG